MPGQIKPIEVKYYPLEEAIQKAAEQNVRRDYWSHLITQDDFDDLDETLKKNYVAEATRLIAEHGMNHMPSYPDNEHIHVAQPAYYPLEVAVVAAAKQYAAHNRLFDFDELDESLKRFYLREARFVLVRDGCFLHKRDTSSKEIIYVEQEEHATA